MSKGRIEAFSDGVIAIIITIMVLEMKVPHGHDLSVLMSLKYIFLSYVLSFVYIAIYWNNHHHMFQTVRHINGRVLWANLHLLFWMSLMPFVTGWMGENHFAPLPVAVYGAVMLMAGSAYFILTLTLIRCHGRESALAIAVGRDWKGKLSVLAYLVAIPLSFVEPMIPVAVYVAVAMVWFIPDRRIERTIGTAA